MGAWASDTFGNDTACDWANELEKVEDLNFVEETLDAVLELGEEYLDSDEACRALSACEVIARLKGRHGLQNSYSEAVDKWVKAHPIEPPQELVVKAVDTIDRILGQDSELVELWSDAGEAKYAEWRGLVLDLRNRVQA